MPESATKDWLQLFHAKGASIADKRELVRVLGDARAVLAADASTLGGILAARHGGKKRKRGNTAAKLQVPEVDEELDLLARAGGVFVAFTDADYPPLLNQIQGAPLGLFVLGNRALLDTPQLAIVGSRLPTPAGRRTTEKFAAELAALGLTITSGLASGIDHAAHRGALDVDGATVAVTATGIDIAYPRGSADLYREIVARGVVVSEFPPGMPPKREHFPRRNRIISGLSLGTLVVEAGLPSGSLITAKLAADQGREVFAVPGPIQSPTSRGCHMLIRQGATLVENSGDILQELGQFFRPQMPAMFAEGDDDDAAVARPDGEAGRLYDMIDYTPAAMDQLILESGLSADKVSYILTDLEIRGLIAATGGGYQRLS